MRFTGQQFGSLQWHDDAYSKCLAGLIRDFVGRKDDLSPDELKEWYAELAWAGRYFFSNSRYIFRASRPSS